MQDFKPIEIIQPEIIIDEPEKIGGPFRKGYDPRRAVKKKGQLNKCTIRIREFWKDIVEKNTEKLQEDLDSMQPFQKWLIIEKLTNYTMPKMNQTTIDGEIEKQVSVKVSFGQLPDANKSIED